MLATIELYEREERDLHTVVLSCLGSAVVALGKLPEKLNPLIHALMNSIQREENVTLQQRTGRSLAHLIQLCVNRVPCPNSKIVKNVCKYLCCVRPKGLWSDTENQVTILSLTFYYVTKEELLTFSTFLKTFASQDEENGSKDKIPKIKKAKEEGGEVKRKARTEDERKEEEEKMLRQRGATFALCSLAEHFESELFVTLPWLWDTMSSALIQTYQLANEQVQLTILSLVSST